jgi:DnaJ-class molecular chaperone
MSLYTTLGLTKDATDEQIRKAYKSSAQRTHPDKEGGNDNEFKAVQLSYDVLSDPERRKEYDETGNTNQKVDLETEVIQELAGLLNSIIANTDVDHSDVFEAARKQVRTMLMQVSSHIGNIHTSIEKQRKVLKRMKCEEGKANTLEPILHGFIADLERQMTSMQHKHIVFGKMLTKLNDYQYEVTPTSNGFYYVG